MTRTDRSRSRRLVPVLCALAVGAAALAAPAPAQARAARGAADLTGDGQDDVLVTASRAVLVLGRTGTVLRTLRPPLVGDYAGESYSLATGDFDGDGRADLVVGDPSSALTGVRWSGALFLYGGTATGVPGTPSRTITEDDLGGLDVPQSSDGFGGALAAGDIDRDGYDDLVVSAGHDWVGATQWAGEVFVLLGGPSGLDPTTAIAFSQATPGIAGTPEPNDGFGTQVALADLTGDGRLDLVVGAGGEESVVGGVGAVHGGIHVLLNGPGGLTTAGSVFVPGLASERQLGERLVTADVTGDGRADVITSSLMQYTSSECGTVSVFKGSAVGITSTRQRVTADTAGVPGTCRTSPTYSRLGVALAADDLNGDGFADVVAGDPRATVSGTFAAGAVTVLFGRSTGLTGTGAVLVSQSSANVPGASEEYDGFGTTVGVADLNGDARLDVLVGTPEEQVGTAVRGAVHGLVSTTTWAPAASSWSRTGAGTTPALLYLGSVVR